MSSGTKVPHAAALSNAEELRALFTDIEGRGRFLTCGTVYERWEFAGSLRRGKPEVGDIEHVVIPRTELVAPKADAGLFGGEAHGAIRLNNVNDRLDELLEDGLIEKALYGETRTTRWGDKYRGFVFKGHRHEVFQCEGANWGPTLAIRTGPAEFSQRLVTQLKGCGLYRQHEGFVRYATGRSASEIRPCPTEEEFFELCGVAWLEPGGRR